MQESIPYISYKKFIKQPSISILKSILKPFSIFFIVFLILSASLNAQKTWDGGAGSTNWGDGNNWNPDGVPLNTDVVNLTSGADLTVNINVPAVCNTLNLNLGARQIVLSITGANTLTVTGAIAMLAPTGGTRNTQLDVNAGTVTCASITSNISGNNNRDSRITIAASGILNVTGNLAMDNNVNQNSITCTGNGIINVGGSFITGTFTPGNGLVNYNGAGAQNVSAFTYYDLTLSNANIKTLQGNSVVSNNLSVTGATFNLGTVPTTFSVTGTSNITSTFDFGGTTSKTVSLTGDLSGAGTITMQGAGLSHILNLGGANNTIGSFTTTASSGSTINYNRGGNQQVMALTAYQNLTLSGSGTKTLQGNATINSNLTITGSTLDFGATLKTVSVTGNLSGTGTLTMTGASIAHVLNLGGANNAISTFNTTASSGSIVNYNRSGNQQVFNNANYQNVTLTGGSTKTLQGSTTINGILNLSNGNLSLGSAAYNLTVASGGSISGTFDNTHMIVCDGTGQLIVQRTTTAGFVQVYPIGTGTYYTPLQISSLTGTVAGTGSISLRAVTGIAPGPPASGSTDLNKYWDITTTNISSINANVNFQYNVAEVLGTQLNYEPYYYSGGTWSIPTGASAKGVYPLSITGTTVLTGIWTARETPKTYYSYQSGDWGVAVTWTTDPSGTLSINPAVPGASDEIVILNGRNVYTTVSRTSYSLQLNEGGTLDLKTSTGHNFGTVGGKGWLKLQTGTFPGGTYTNFVSADGGTVVYYNTASFNLSQYTYNNLIFELSGAGIIASVLGNLTVNGDLTIKTGTFRINDNTATTRLDLTVYGDVLVETSGLIATGTGVIGTTVNDAHRFIIQGDFTNNGQAKFSNLVAADYLVYPSNRVDVVFNNGSADQNVTINGLTQFYRIEVNKGTNQTYVLNIDASASNLFYLFGVNNTMGVTPSPGPPNINNVSALGLLAGTLRLGTNINLPSLAEETSAGQDFEYFIDEDACLWIDGATVTHTTNVNGGNSNSFVLYGKLRMSNATSSLNINDLHGLIMRSTASIEIENGTLSVPCIRTSLDAGTHRGSYNQSGGSVTVTGNLLGSNAHASFSLTWPEMSFKMSGGTLAINEATSSGNGNQLCLVIGSNANNNSVTGGTVTIVARNRNGNFTSTAPFWNLNIDAPVNTYETQIIGFTGSASAATVAAQPLVVLNDLNIINSGALNPFSNSVSVAGDFTIGASANYKPDLNTTNFNGLTGQLFQINGTISTNLYNLTIDNSSNTTISKNITVRNILTLNSSTFLNDQGFTITALGNIVNSGTHTSQANGGILLTATTDQYIGGLNTGVFGNFTVNKTSGTTILTADQSITGNLRLASGLLSANVYKLSFGSTSNIYDALTGTTAAFSATKMISTSGNGSDGGIDKTFSSTGTFLFPLGTAGDYTPATIQISIAPTSWGSINIKPITQYQQFVTSTNSLNYFWKVSSTGFAGVTAGSISHIYNYVDADLVGRGTEANYIPGVYNPYSWTYINNPAQVNDVTNSILFSNINTIDGDYTAGEINAFQAIKVFYSRQDGNWNDVNTWSSVAIGGPVDGALPTLFNPVVIGDGAGINHTITVPAGFNNIQTGGLLINEGSVLDVTTTTGHNFGSIPNTVISGSGKLKISSAIATATFPGGDFGNFLLPNGGTVEYYNIGAVNFQLPAGNASYNNLIISPVAGRTITMPNINMLIYGNLDVSNSGIAQLNSAAARTFQVKGLVNVNAGTLRFMNNTFAQTFTADSNITIALGAVFDVSTATNATNLLYIYGNVINNGTFDMYAGAATRVTNVYFTGSDDKSISGTGTNDFNYLNINKGTSRNTILDVTANNLTLNGTGTALILSNGTFRVSNSLLSFTLSTTASFSIPNTAAISVNQGTVNIGVNNDAGDLILTGRLEVINVGVVNIGVNGSNFNNDIEYATGGIPEIIVSGSAVLYVNGQIRRSTSLTNGSLNYDQSGGTVTIAARNSNSTRAALEITNNSSLFNFSGGTLIIENSVNGTASFGDILITPASSNITGGTLQVGSTNTTISVFEINTSSPLWNLTVDGTTTNKTLGLKTNNLVVKNNLTTNGNSIFKANGFSVNIGGNLVNNNSASTTGVATGGYQPGVSTQITTFSGSSAQTISGTVGNITNFANLNISTLANITLLANSNLRVNTNLYLNSGILNDGGNTITTIGNIDNNAIHSSSLITGGILLSGSGVQTLSGNGSGQFGNVIVNNSLGIEMVDNNTFNGVLTFTNGSIYIDDYLLSFGASATVAGSPGASNMIIANGVISDAGVKKTFSSGISSFTFPIGVAAKYTPVTLSFTANSNSNGTITVKPINADHPSLFNANGDELSYYWSIVSSGFSSAFTVNQTYNYLDSDVAGSEVTYVTGRFVAPNWIPAGGIPGSVNDVSNQINLTSVGYLDGEYTSGTSLNFTDFSILYSRISGDWNNGNTWSTTGHSGGACGCTPTGNPVEISSAHTVTITANSANAYSVLLGGILNIGSTVFHNLGYVDGAGKIVINSTVENIFVLPGGNYDDFLANSASTLEFTGTENAYLPLKPGNIYKPYQNVIITGTGEKLISAEDLKILGDLTINSTSKVNNTNYHRQITINGDWIDNNPLAIGGFIPGNGIVSFEGNTAQVLSLTGGSTIEQFYTLKINNSTGLTISGAGQAEVTKYLYLTNGLITTTNTNLLRISNTATNAVIGGGSGSFINGPLQKSISTGSYFTYPVGDGVGNRYGSIYLSEVSSAGNYIAQYLNHNPGLDGYDPASKVVPVDVVSNLEYWRIFGPAATTANVTVRWDALSGIIPSNAISRSKLRIVEWNSTAWENKGNLVSDGGVTSGTIKTSPATAVNSNHYFTFGIESLPTATITSSSASICNDGSTTNISIDLTGVAPWTLKYKVNGANETTLNNIAISPYNLVVSYSMIPLNTGPGVYSFNVSYISDATGSVGIKNFTSTVAITLNDSPLPVISGNTTAAVNENNVMYSTPAIAGHTYLWSYSGPTGTIHNGLLTGNTLNMHWGTVAGAGWVMVQETVTVGGCSRTTANYVVTISDIPNPLVTGSAIVCNEDTLVYRTPRVGTHTYSWNLPLGGGSILGSTTLDSVVVIWSTAGNYSVSVSETGSSTVSNTLNVLVNPLPSDLNVVDVTPICLGETATIIVRSASAGIDYQLRLDSDNSSVGGLVNSGPGGDVSINVLPSSTTLYNILAINEFNCTAIMVNTPNVVVNTLPVANIGSDQNICEGQSLILDAGAGYAGYLWSTGGATQTETIVNSGPMSAIDIVNVSVTVTDTNGCEDISDVITITIYPNADSGPIYFMNSSIFN